MLKYRPITTPIEEVTAVRFSPDGRWLAVGHRDGRVQVQATQGDGLVPYRQLPGNASAILNLQFSKASQ